MWQQCERAWREKVSSVQAVIEPAGPGHNQLLRIAEPLSQELQPKELLKPRDQTRARRQTRAAPESRSVDERRHLVFRDDQRADLAETVLLALRSDNHRQQPIIHRWQEIPRGTRAAVTEKGICQRERQSLQ
jgi:hypothetical protein